MAALGAYSEICQSAAQSLELPDRALEIMRSYPFEVFVPLGKIAVSGSEVFAGVKPAVATDAIERVARKLYIGDQLLRHNPERLASLPQFVLPLAMATNTDLSYGYILLEDFSQDNGRSISRQRQHYPDMQITRDIVPAGLSRDVFDAFRGQIYRPAFSAMSGMVAGREVLVDFDSVADAEPPQRAQYIELAESLVVTVERETDAA